MSDKSFDKAFADVIGIEGKYSNHPADRGGETMFGITIAVARKHGYTGPMRSMPLGVAKRIYRADYWNKLNLDEVAKRSDRIAHEMFDTGVNMGTSVAGMFLQDGLNIFNRNGKDYADIKVDGQIGPASLKALDAFLARRKLEGEIVLLKDLNIQQGARYRQIVKNNPSQEEFMFGWYKRINLNSVGA